MRKSLQQEKEQEQVFKKILKKGKMVGKQVSQPIQKQYDKVKIFQKINDKTTVQKSLQQDILFVLQHKRKPDPQQISYLQAAFPIKGTLTDSFVTLQDLSVNRLKELSIIPIVSQLYLEIFSNLVQLQTQVDPVTLKPMKIPGKDQSIIKFLHTLKDLDMKTLDKLQSILSIYKQKKQTYKLMKQKILNRILTKVEEVLRFFNFEINFTNFSKVIYNENTGYYTVQTAQQVQNTAVQFAMTQFNKQNLPDVESFNKQYCENILRRHEMMFDLQVKQKQKHQFIEVDEVPDPNKQILDQLSKIP